MGRVSPLRMEMLRCECENDLDRHVLPAPERTPNCRVDHPHLLDLEVECVRDLFLILVRPLASDLNRHPAFIVDIGVTGFWLKVGMLLVGHFVGCFDNAAAAAQPAAMSPLRIL